MANSVTIPTQRVSRAASRTMEGVRSATSSVPWYIWCAVLAVTSAMVGVHWDISWHVTIGRDTFWTPAHLAIQFCGVLAGLSCGYVILATTFGSDTLAQETSVKMWGFRGPLGAFVCAWGSTAMVTSAPFDNWWHNAYGLDVKILSPPHVLLLAGILSVQLGALILILGAMNRARDVLRERLNLLFLYVGGMVIVQAAILITDYTWRGAMHSALCYRVVAMAIPIPLVAIKKASRDRWASMTAVGTYTAFWLGMLWILPLFPGQPKLGPVYQHVTHFIPPPFPLLLIVPALAFDLLWPTIVLWKPWRQAVVGGSTFLLTFIAVQWPFADFLMRPASRNWIFGTHYFGYGDPAGFFYNPNEFAALEKTRAEFWIGIGAAFMLAIVTARIGLAWGKWMEEIRR